jgi:hypothetical protein
VARVSRRRIGPSGIAPVQPAFAPVLPNAFFYKARSPSVGASPGGLSHGATWRESAHSPLRYGVFACGEDGESCKLLPCKDYADCVVDDDLPISMSLQTESIDVPASSAR